MIIPRVKKEQKIKGNYLLPYEIIFSVDVKYRNKLSLLMSCFFPKSKVEYGNSNPNITTIYKKQDNKEGYMLRVDKNGVLVEYADYIGLRNALATLSMMAVAKEDGFSLKFADVEDYPIASHRGVMLDLARGTKSYEALYNDIVLIAKAKMNHLHLHLADSIGICVCLDCLPEECYLKDYYTKLQMQEILELASALALEIIPEFDMPGHSTCLAKCFSNIDCDIEEEVHTHWTTCAGSEETYEFYEKIINELCELFPSKYFHIGGDELEFADLPNAKAICHWEQCPKCRKKCEEENLKDRQELYYYFINRIYAIVKKTGRQMIMWSDQIDCLRPTSLPNDIIMQFWRVAAPGRGPFEGCSLKAQLKMGYNIINSHFPETYIDCEEYMSEQTIQDWRWDKRPETDEGYRKNIIGSEICAWEYGNYAEYSHYDLTLAPSVLIMADKLWNGDNLLFNDEYEKALSKAVLGIGAIKGINIFKCFGSVIPPRNNEYAYYDRIQCSVDDIKKIIEQLNMVLFLDNGSKNRISIYSDVLQNIIEKIMKIKKE